MNGFRTAIGIEYDDKYIDAKSKVIEFIKALNALSPEQSQKLANEVLTSVAMATSLEQFVSYMNNGGQV